MIKYKARSQKTETVEVEFPSGKTGVFKLASLTLGWQVKYSEIMKRMSKEGKTAQENIEILDDMIKCLFPENSILDFEEFGEGDLAELISTVVNSITEDARTEEEKKTT